MREKSVELYQNKKKIMNINSDLFSVPLSQINNSKISINYTLNFNQLPEDQIQQIK